MNVYYTVTSLTGCEFFLHLLDIQEKDESKDPYKNEIKGFKVREEGGLKNERERSTDDRGLND